jgi:hypothetical protein
MMLTHLMRSAYSLRAGMVGSPALARAYSRAAPALRAIILNDDDLFAEDTLPPHPPAAASPYAPVVSSSSSTSQSSQRKHSSGDRSALAQGAVDAFLGSRVPFAALGLRPQLVANLDRAGFACSTAIQVGAVVDQSTCRSWCFVRK